MNRNDASLIIRNTDLNAAVHAGVLDEPTATRLVDFVARGSVAVDSDDENLRLITGFNDIFVVIGLALFLGAISFVFRGLSVFIVPFAAWLLAEVFTRRMRMALPSIVLLLVFVFSVFSLVAHLMENSTDWGTAWFGNLSSTAALAATIVAVGAAVLHWWRFHVPITFAAGMAALAGVLVSALDTVFPNIFEKTGGLVFLPLGLIVFVVAMYFDSKDRARRTQLSDRSFWLHLLAAPMIVHPLVWNMTRVDDLTVSGAAMIVGLFVVLGIVALIVDRRALMVSSLIYLGYALSTIIGKQAFGTEGAGIAVLAVGSVVLLLSVAWKPLRRAIVPNLPYGLRDLVPLPT